MAFKRDRVKPTSYPRVVFHTIRGLQLLSSLVVALIMVFFYFELKKGNMKLPWTFIFLFAVSLLTTLALIITIFLHCCHGLNPTLNSGLNTGLAIVWSVSFSLLAWWSSRTITHACNAKNWENSTGIMVCRLYKILFSFAACGLVSTLAALVLDIKVQREANKRGKFQQIEMQHGNDSKEDNRIWDTGNPIGNATRMTRSQNRDSYELPEGQRLYHDDTSYHGPGH